MHTCFVGRIVNSYSLSSQHETFSFETKYEKFRQVRLIGFNKQNQKFPFDKTIRFNRLKLLVSTIGNYHSNLSGTSKGIYMKQPKADTFSFGKVSVSA